MRFLSPRAGHRPGLHGGFRSSQRRLLQKLRTRVRNGRQQYSSRSEGPPRICKRGLWVGYPVKGLEQEEAVEFVRWERAGLPEVGDDRREPVIGADVEDLAPHDARASEATGEGGRLDLEHDAAHISAVGLDERVDGAPLLPVAAPCYQRKQVAKPASGPRRESTAELPGGRTVLEPPFEAVNSHSLTICDPRDAALSLVGDGQTRVGREARRLLGR